MWQSSCQAGLSFQMAVDTRPASTQPGGISEYIGAAETCRPALLWLCCAWQGRWLNNTSAQDGFREERRQSNNALQQCRSREQSAETKYQHGRGRGQEHTTQKTNIATRHNIHRQGREKHAVMASGFRPLVCACQALATEVACLLLPTLPPASDGQADPRARDMTGTACQAEGR